MSQYDSIAGSSFVVSPLERHDFSPGADSYLCICGRPRALHLHDGFVPAPDRHLVSMDPRVRYNRHPHFFRPGTLNLNKAEQEQVDRLFSKRAQNIHTPTGRAHGGAQNHSPAIKLGRRIGE